MAPRTCATVCATRKALSRQGRCYLWVFRRRSAGSATVGKPNSEHSLEISRSGAQNVGLPGYPRLACRRAGTPSKTPEASNSCVHRFRYSRRCADVGLLAVADLIHHRLGTPVFSVAELFGLAEDTLPVRRALSRKRCPSGMGAPIQTDAGLFPGVIG